jgi:hypothetical protein
LIAAIYPGLTIWLVGAEPLKSLKTDVVGEAGIEPTTPGLEGRCSIRLSYSPAGGTFRIVASLIVIGTAARKMAPQAVRAVLVSTPQPAA